MFSSWVFFWGGHKRIHPTQGGLLLKKFENHCSNILKLSESKQNNSIPFPVPFCVVLELPVTSPLANAVLKTLENWEQILLEKINKFDGPPPNYINTYPTDLSAGGGPAILRHKAMLEPDNTPFKWVFDLDVTIKPKTYWIFKKGCMCVHNCTFYFFLFRSKQRFSFPARRLWHFLVKQEVLQETLIRYIFTKKRKQSEVSTEYRGGTRHWQNKWVAKYF